MTVLITFTSIGVDAGPFNLYSNVDGYSSAFVLGVTRTQLLAGYPSSVVPAGTTIIRAKSFSACTNFIDLPIVPAPTTTTTSSSSTTTTTSSSSTTTTTTTLNCRLVDVVISVADAEDSTDGTVQVYYTDCLGGETFQNYPDAGSYPGSLCAIFASTFALSYIKDGETLNAGTSSATPTATNCP